MAHKCPKCGSKNTVVLPTGAGNAPLVTCLPCQHQWHVKETRGFIPPSNLHRH